MDETQAIKRTVKNVCFKVIGDVRDNITFELSLYYTSIVNSMDHPFTKKLKIKRLNDNFIQINTNNSI